MYVKCGDCLYWFLQQGNKGQCRRHAPRPVILRLEYLVRWPETLNVEGCGDGKTRPKGEQPKQTSLKPKQKSTLPDPPAELQKDPNQ